MKKYLTKRNIYITLFTILYLAVGIVSLIHSFAFFGLANTPVMAVMLGCCFEVGQVAVLMSLLTSKKEQSRVMPWILMIILTTIQILGNVFSSYKYLMLHSSGDLEYFKKPIFIWTDLPDDMTTVIITYLVGALLPIIALCMTSMVSNYIMDTEESHKIEPEEKEQILDNHERDIEEKSEELPVEPDNADDNIERHPEGENTSDSKESEELLPEVEENRIRRNHFVNLK